MDVIIVFSAHRQHYRSRYITNEIEWRCLKLPEHSRWKWVGVRIETVSCEHKRRIEASKESGGGRRMSRNNDVVGVEFAAGAH